MSGLRFINVLQCPEFLEKSDLVEIHDRLIARFGGSYGFLNEESLDSAIALPRQSFGGELFHPTIFDQAAAYLYYISKNHAFIDGNKRTALAAVNAFLPMNGYKLKMPKLLAYQMVIDVVTGRISKEDVSALICEHSVPYEIS